MSDTITGVVDDTVAELNATTFSQAFTASKRYLPITERSGLSSLVVSVAPGPVEISQANRRENNHDVRVDILVQRQADPDDNAEMDSLVALSEEIARHLTPHADASFPIDGVIWQETQHDPLYLPSHLRELRIFTSVIRYTARLIEPGGTL